MCFTHTADDMAQVSALKLSTVVVFSPHFQTNKFKRNTLNIDCIMTDDCTKLTELKRYQHQLTLANSKYELKGHLHISIIQYLKHRPP